MKRRGLLVALTATAGCGGVESVLGPTASVSNISIELTDNGPFFTFDYAVDDYTDALLENPNGDVVNRGTLEPSQSEAALFAAPNQPGTYWVILRRGGETLTETSRSYDGADLSIREVTEVWNHNTLEELKAILANEGDLPANLTELTATVGGEQLGGERYGAWIEAGTEATLTVGTQYAGVTVSEPGTVDGEIRATTPTGTARATFQQQIDPPTLEIVAGNPSWQDLSLVDASVIVRNTGDIPTAATARLEHEGETLGESQQTTVPPGETTELQIGDFGALFRAEEGGELAFRFVVDGDETQVDQTFTHQIEQPDLSIVSVTPDWEQGTLNGVDTRVENSGDLPDEASGTLYINDESVLETEWNIQPGTETVSFASLGHLYRVKTGGDVTIRVELTHSGTTDSQTTTTTVSAPEGEISEIDLSAWSQFDSNQYDVSTANFTVENTGSVVLYYDRIEVTVDGTTRADNPISEISIEPGSDYPGTVPFTDPIVVDGGETDVSITLLTSGTSVVEESTTVSVE